MKLGEGVVGGAAADRTVRVLMSPEPEEAGANGGVNLLRSPSLNRTSSLKGPGAGYGGGLGPGGRVSLNGLASTLGSLGGGGSSILEHRASVGQGPAPGSPFSPPTGIAGASTTPGSAGAGGGGTAMPMRMGSRTPSLNGARGGAVVAAAAAATVVSSPGSALLDPALLRQIAPALSGDQVRGLGGCLGGGCRMELGRMKLQLRRW